MFFCCALTRAAWLPIVSQYRLDSVLAQLAYECFRDLAAPDKATSGVLSDHIAADHIGAGQTHDLDVRLLKLLAEVRPVLFGDLHEGLDFVGTWEECVGCVPGHR